MTYNRIIDKDFLKPRSRNSKESQIKNENLNQIILIDKPVGWTSFDVVAKIRGILSNRENYKVKVGHSGTLDPFATGLLIILCGDATKKQDSYMKLDKEYDATLKLGYTSTTGDPEGEITPFCHSKQSEESKKILRFTQDDIKRILKKFNGEIEQTPPAYSAIKINGKRAYMLAREGKEVIIKPRKIKINDIKILNYKFPELKIKVKCSSGTYIRTLAEDIGRALNCGAYLTELRRTKIGKYNILDAKTLDTINIEV